MTSTKIVSCTLAVLAMCIVIISEAHSVPIRSVPKNPYYNEIEDIPDNILMELMARFGQTIMKARTDLENSKRTVDFGLARGYSGTQEAKYRMGLAAANFAGGPGRRRRSEIDV